MIPALADNVVRRQLPRIIADAERLMGAVAWPDLPAGLRIIDIADGRLSGFSLGSGHRLAQAHGCRRGAVAVAAVAADRLRLMLRLWSDDLPAALGEAALGLEETACHELSHALAARQDRPFTAADGDTLRRLPAIAAACPPASPERSAEDHGAAWAAGLVILGDRCRRLRPGARHRWPEVIAGDLRCYGIDPQAVADAVGDVADDEPLQSLLAPGGDIVRRVADAIPGEADRAGIIAAAHDKTLPAEPRHVAAVAAGMTQEVVPWTSSD